MRKKYPMRCWTTSPSTQPYSPRQTRLIVTVESSTGQDGDGIDASLEMPEAHSRKRPGDVKALGDLIKEREESQLALNSRMDKQHEALLEVMNRIAATNDKRNELLQQILNK